MALMVAIGIAIVVGGLTLLRNHLEAEKEASMAIKDPIVEYKADAEIESAKNALVAGVQSAEVITTLQDGSRRIALVFDGMPDAPEATQILNVLRKHNTPAVFFVEGQNAVDQPDTIQQIRDAGYEIGNYTFVGISAVEKIRTDRLLAELCKAQKGIREAGAPAPALFRAPRTEYTDDVLRLVRAAGIPQAVKASAYYPKDGVKDAAAALAYAGALPPGSILSIRLTEPVDRYAPRQVTPNERPAIDMQPTIKDPEGGGAPAAPVVRQTLAKDLDLFLTACEGVGLQVESVHAFRTIHYVPNLVAKE